MQRKLVLWTYSPPRIRTLTLTLASLSSTPSKRLSSRSRKHLPSPPDDPYDPPFSPIPRALDPKPQPPPKTEYPSRAKDLHFDFRYSYSETDPSVRPIGFREPPRFSPFGPGRLDRKWDGVSAPARAREDPARVSAERSAVLGEPLTEEEVEELVEQYRHSDCARQINLGKGGVTHNMLDDIHNHWQRAEAVRIKCLGVPTLDMDNVCFHLEDKTGGKIIYRKINILLLYRGRNYDTKQRPVVPLMLWKPYAPIYPKLVKNVADGLTFEETKDLRSRGMDSPALMKLTRNGVYVNVVEKIREAFETSEVVRLDCTNVDASDCKKIGVKLRILFPMIFRSINGLAQSREMHPFQKARRLKGITLITNGATSFKVDDRYNNKSEPLSFKWMAVSRSHYLSSGWLKFHCTQLLRLSTKLVLL